MRNSKVAIGIDVLENALKQLTDLTVQELDFIPPNRLSVTVMIEPVVMGRKAVLYPNAIIQPSIAGGRLRLEVIKVNLFGLTVPRPLIQQQLDELVQVPEQEVNAIIQVITTKTSLKLAQVSCTNDSLVLTFDGK